MKRLAALLLFGITAVLLLARADDQKSSPAPPAPPKAYSPTQIPEAAGRALSTLETIRRTVASNPALDDNRQRQESVLKEAARLRKRLKIRRPEELPLRQVRTDLEALNLQLKILRDETALLQNDLEKEERSLKKLRHMKARWQATLEALKKSDAPSAIIKRAQTTRETVKTDEERLKTLYDRTLTALNALTDEIGRTKTLAHRLEASLASRGTRLFNLDSPPLPQLLAKSGLHPGRWLKELALSARNTLRQSLTFYLADRNALLNHLGLTLILAIVMFYLYLRNRRNRLFVKRDERVGSAVVFVEHPVAATLLLAILTIPLFYPERPLAVGQFNTLAALGLLMWIMREEASISVKRHTVTLALVYALTALQTHISSTAAEVRLSTLLIEAFMLFITWRFVGEGKALFGENDRAVRLFARLLPLVPLLLTVSLAANIVGAVNLSFKLFSALIVSLILFVIFALIARIARGLVVMFVRRRTFQAQNPTLEAHARQIQSYLTFTVNLFLMGYWFYLVLRQFDALYYLSRWWQSFTALSWQVGKVTLSVGALVDFALVLAITAFITRLVTVLLDLEVFSRYRFPRGVPAAIRMMVRYLIIAVGSVFALTVLGISFSDLSVIAGALGVGIGFGLRNIMANFVSGLLLIFERPVQQGDVVQVGNVTGDVEKIGVRATTIKTYDGSEVLIPNADFITKEVTNWTLSSKSRRIRVDYKVAFGHDPKEVIALIRQTVSTCEGVRNDPEPKVLFEGFGEYYLAFTLYFWVDGRVLDIKNDVALAVYEALTTAGIRMPVPISRIVKD
ncbi:MAG: mechanosensitive ion channel [Epsilonproteobacteria bacterium]|nr:mechanosensitive ion channel [Campylobacterota bacterium]